MNRVKLYFCAHASKSIKLSTYCVLSILFLLIIGSYNQQAVAAKLSPKAVLPLTVEDYVIKGVQLGEPIYAVQQKMGLLKSKEHRNENLSYDYGDIELIVNSREKIINVLTDSPSIATRRGIHPGALVQDVKLAYGDSYQKMEFGELDLYEYTFSTASGREYTLRFAVNRSTNTVTYIGSRISAEKATTGLAYVSSNRKWGYIDTYGNIAIPLTFDFADSFSQGLAVVKVNGKYGYIDTSGNMVIQPQFEHAFTFREGLAVVEVNRKYGCIDRQGNRVVAPIYDYVSHYSQGLAVVKINNKYGYVDVNGKIVIAPQYESAAIFSEGLAAVTLNGKDGYIDKSGSIVIPPRYDHVREMVAGKFSDGLAAVPVDDKWGYIDKQGKMVIAPQYDWAWDFSQGLARVDNFREGTNKKSGYVDSSGNMVIEFFHDDVMDKGDFSEGLAAISIRGKCAYIDRSGTVIITPRFASDDIAYNQHQFSQGLASVKIDRKYGYINQSGEMVIEPQYDWAGTFTNE